MLLRSTENKMILIHICLQSYGMHSTKITVGQVNSMHGCELLMINKLLRVTLDLVVIINKIASIFWLPHLTQLFHPIGNKAQHPFHILAVYNCKKTSGILQPLQ